MQVGLGEEGVGGIGGKPAEEADLQGQNAVIKAQAAKGIDIALDAQGGEVVGDGVSLQSLGGPAGGIGLLVGVDRGSLEAQLQADACAEGGGNRYGAGPGVDIGLEAEAGAGGHTAAQGAEGPLMEIGVIVELALVVACQLGADIQAGVGAVVLDLVDGTDGVIGAHGHSACIVEGRNAYIQFRLHQPVVHGEAGAAVIKVIHIQAVVAAPDKDVEHGVVCGGGNEDPEQGIDVFLNAVEYAGDLAAEGVAYHVVPKGKAAVCCAKAVLEIGCHIQYQGLGVLIHQLYVGQVDDLEGHGYGLYQCIVLIHAGLQAFGGLGLQPAGLRHGFIGEDQGVGDDGDGGKGEGVVIHGLGLGGKPV